MLASGGNDNQTMVWSAAKIKSGGTPTGVPVAPPVVSGSVPRLNYKPLLFCRPEFYNCASMEFFRLPGCLQSDCVVAASAWSSCKWRRHCRPTQ